jgi:acetylornithine deacetylase
MNIHEAIYKKAIDLKTETIELLTALISAETTDYNEENGQKLVRRFLESIGAECFQVQPDPERLGKYPEFNPGHTYDNRKSVVGLVKGKDKDRGKSILLHAHMDTVFPASRHEWNTDPFRPEIIDDKLYGLGAADTKGSMATMLMSIKILKELGIELAGDVMFQSVVDEEAGGGNGSLACIDAGYRTDAVIIGEPNNLNPMSAHVGSYAFRIKVEGKSAHANTKWKGTSAFEKAFPIVIALQELEKKWNKRTYHLLPSPVITVIEIKAGDGSITLPGSCEMLVNYTYLPDGYDYFNEIISVIKASIENDSWFDDHELQIEKHHDCGPYYNDPKREFATTVKEISGKVLSREVNITGMGCGADARLYANVGQMSTMILGPGNIENAHQPNEFVIVEELVKAVQLYASILVEWCGVR